MTTILDNATQKALTTIARVKIFMGVSGDSKDAKLTQLINQVTGFIEQYTKRNMLSQTYTDEEYDGTGIDTLILRQFPVTTFTQLQVNSATDNSDSWETINASRYFAGEDGRVRFATSKGSFLSTDSGFFIEDKNKYRVTYDAGFLIDFANENDPTKHTLPQEIEYAAHKLISGAFNLSKGQGYKSHKVGDISAVFNKELFEDKEIKSILNKYVSATI